MSNQYRCIYTSSFDRGLYHILKIWPDVKKEVPEATLDVFYGWMLFERFYKDNPASMAWMKNIQELLKQEGVTDHDRIPQPQLKEEYKTSALFVFPTHFGEINCMSAIKAQAYGAIPVTMDYAALTTTVQFGIKIKGDIYDKEVLEVFKQQLIWALKNKEWQDQVRPPMMEWASKITWSAIAKQWSSVFKGESPSEIITVPQNRVLKIIDGSTGKEI